MIVNDSRCQECTEARYHSGILLSAHLHPKGMAVSPQVKVWSLRASERDEMGEDINTARDGLHLSTVHRGLLISWPNCAPICWQKKKFASIWCNSNIFSFLFLFFPLCPCSVWECSVLGKKDWAEHIVVDLLLDKLEISLQHCKW